MNLPEEKECPNCHRIMYLREDNGRFYQEWGVPYYQCPRCGNSYSVRGGQLNDSKFNKTKAKDVNTADNCLLLAILCFILLIGYCIYGFFFASINFIILGVIIAGLILFILGYIGFNNTFYYKP
jgi:hypothetical protein